VIHLLASARELDAYDAWVKAQPYGTLWQSLEWRQFLAARGKDVRVYAAEAGGQLRAGGLTVIDRTSLGLSTWEIPRGPVWAADGEELAAELLDAIIADAKRERCMALYCSPMQPLATTHRSLATSSRHIHCEATRILDLTPPEEAILAQMKPKGRYNIRVAEKHGVQVRESGDIGAFAALVALTSRRDGFTALPEAAYQAFLESLPGSFLLLAFSADTPVAGLLGVCWNKRGIYYYGASSYEHRALMAPYALQWEAMRLCKTRGCHQYDLLGIAPENAGERHPWAGVTRFKEQFGGTVETYPAEQELVLRPAVKALLDWKRKVLG